MGVESVIATQVLDTTSVGRSLMTAADAAAARTALSLGTLATQNGTISDYLTAAAAASTYQVVLVSGTNIKTINSTSLLGSGNITVSASPAGSSGQVQYNNAGAFGGMTAVVYAGTGTHVAITSQAAATIPLCVKGAASQSGNLTEWQNSSGTILARIASSGSVVTGGTVTVGYGNFSVPTIVLGDSSAGFGTDSTTIYGRAGSTTVWAAATNSFRVGASQVIGFASTGAASNSADSGFARNAAGVIEVNSGTAGTFRDLIVRNLGLNGAVSAGGGVGVQFVANATTSPTTNPTGGGILYCEGGALKFRGSSGTVTTLGPA